VPDPPYVATALAVTVAITVTLRALPFAVTSRIAGSALLADLGRWMPLGAVTVLALSCLTRIDLGGPTRGVPELVGVVVTVAAHLWRRNVVLSIVAGTATCMLLSNGLLPV
jgi:branched-subunit amino acid transport protein AzlD